MELTSVFLVHFTDDEYMQAVDSPSLILAVSLIDSWPTQVTHAELSSKAATLPCVQMTSPYQ